MIMIFVLDYFSWLRCNFSNCCGKKNDDAENSGYALDTVKRKISDSLQAFEFVGDLGNKVLQREGYIAKQPLSLNVVVDGRRLRLLWASFLRIEEEVSAIFVLLCYNLFFPFVF